MSVKHVSLILLFVCRGFFLIAGSLIQLMSEDSRKLHVPTRNQLVQIEVSLDICQEDRLFKNRDRFFREK